MIGGAISIEEARISAQQQKEQGLVNLQNQIDELKNERSQYQTNGPDVEKIGELMEKLIERLDRYDEEKKQ